MSTSIKVYLIVSCISSHIPGPASRPIPLSVIDCVLFCSLLWGMKSSEWFSGKNKLDRSVRAEFAHLRDMPREWILWKVRPLFGVFRLPRWTESRLDFVRGRSGVHTLPRRPRLCSSVRATLTIYQRLLLCVRLTFLAPFFGVRCVCGTSRGSRPFLALFVCVSVFLSLLHSSSFAFIRRSFCRVIHHLLFGLSPLFTVALFFWLLPWLPSQRATVAPFFFAGWRRRAKKTKPKLNLFGHWKWKNSEKLGVTEFSHLLTLPIHRGTRKIT